MNEDIKIENLKYLGTVFGLKMFLEVDPTGKDSTEFQVLNTEKYFKKLWEKQDEENLKLYQPNCLNIGEKRYEQRKMSKLRKITL